MDERLTLSRYLKRADLRINDLIHVSGRSRGSLNGLWQRDKAMIKSLALAALQERTTQNANHLIDELSNFQ